MALHPQVRGLLDQLAAANAPAFSDLPPAEGRQAFNALIQMLPPTEARVAETRELRVAGGAGDIGARLYVPQNAPEQGPALVYIHGGGFVIGDLESYDPVCRGLCAGAGIRVVSIDYRRAPEHPFPAAPDDCLGAFRWVRAHAAELGIDPQRVAIGGDSAGGNLSAVTALRLRDAGEPLPSAQLLLYPVVHIPAEPTQSMRDNAEGYLLTQADMAWFVDNYVPKDQALDDPGLAPLHARDHRGLPPARVVTAAFDPLCDDGRLYADALEAAGVDVTRSHHDDTIHGFFSFYTLLDGGREEMAASCAWLRKAVAG